MFPPVLRTNPFFINKAFLKKKPKKWGHEKSHPDLGWLILIEDNFILRPLPGWYLPCFL